MPAKIVIAESQPWCREYVRHVCVDKVGMEVVGETASGTDAIEMIVRLSPDIALVDLRLNGENGLRVLEAVTAARPQVRIVVMTAVATPTVLEQVAKFRVMGFFAKEGICDEWTLEWTLREVRAGRQAHSPDFTETLRQWRRNPNACDKLLTNCERKVVALVGLAQSDKEIARNLEIDIRTVQGHRLRAMDKLGITTIPKLMQYAIDVGLTEFQDETRLGATVTEGAWVIQ